MHDPHVYPGEGADARMLRSLACAYADAARGSAASIRCRCPVSVAPTRLLAIQAIELHLSAFLVSRGWLPCGVRRLGHDVARRAALAAGEGLVLRRRTVAHIEALSRDREYLVARYGPERLAAASEINRLLATLDEVGRKTALPAVGFHGTGAS